MRIALMGVGSLGTIMGALVAKNGGEMVLIDANKEHVDALNKNGATVTGKMNLNVPVKAITPEEMTGKYDLVFYLVKQTYNDVALKQLLPHLAEDGFVCTLQNGVPEDAVAEIVGKERIVGGTVGWGATWIGPGISMLTSEPDKMTFDIGEISGKVTDRIKKAKEVLDLVGKAEIVTNLMGYRWTKLLVNATFSGMSVALGCTYGDILDNEKALKCAQHIADETIKVAHAQNIKIESLQGHNLEILEFNNKVEMKKTTPYYSAIFGPHRGIKASMLQDLEKGRRCEIDAINGVVSKKGKETGVLTPINDKVVEIVKNVENGKMSAVFDNLDLFQLPEVPKV